MVERPIERRQAAGTDAAPRPAASSGARLDLNRRYGGAALVTGASSGIGEAFARRLAREGMDLVLVARRADRLVELAQTLSVAHSVTVHSISQDLGERDGPARTVAAADALGVEIGMLVSNAGFGTYGPFLAQDPEQQISIPEVNNRAPVALACAIAPRLVARGRGAMIFLSSTAAYQPVPFEAVYGASKAFNLMFGEALWAELRPHGVDVCVLSPGFTPTEYQRNAGMGEVKPITGWTTPEEVVEACLRRLGRGPSVVPGWRNRVVIALMRVLPRSAQAMLTYRVNNPAKR
jgi:short-subunit dehydrogenase